MNAWLVRFGAPICAAFVLLACFGSVAQKDKPTAQAPPGATRSISVRASIVDASIGTLHVAWQGVEEEAILVISFQDVKSRGEVRPVDLGEKIELWWINVVRRVTGSGEINLRYLRPGTDRRSFNENLAIVAVVPALLVETFPRTDRFEDPQRTSVETLEPAHVPERFVYVGRYGTLPATHLLPDIVDVLKPSTDTEYKIVSIPRFSGIDLLARCPLSSP
jgi:hypothetical protein